MTMTEILPAPRGSACDYEALLEFLYLTPVGILKFRPGGAIVMANPVAAQVLLPLSDDGDLEDIYAVFLRIVPDLRARVESFQPFSGPVCDQMQLAVPDSDSVLTLDIYKVDPDTLMAVVQDISCAILQERRIRVDQQRFRAIFDHVRDYAICTVAVDGRIDGWNRSLNRLGGWDEADVVDASICIFFPPADDGEACGAALIERAREGGTSEFEGWGIRKDGSRFWGNTVATLLPDRTGHPGGYVLITRDLTERKQMEDRLIALATIDPLTGAPNRRAGEVRLDDAFRQWRRLGRAFSLLMVDCDHFKAINDRWGHEAGDEVLSALVRICGENTRDGDTTIRWGGEEFLLLLPGSGCEIATIIAERLRSAVEAAVVTFGSAAIKVTVSIGVAECSVADNSLDDVMRRSDRALYRAKNAGRNRVVLEPAAPE